MKRQTSLEKEAFSKRSEKSWLKGISRSNKTYNRYKTYSTSKGVSKDSSKTHTTGHLFAPEKLSIYGMGRKKEDIVYEDTINFLNNFRRIEGQSKVIVDFSKTEHITAPIVLMLYSILDLLPEDKKPKIQIMFSKTEHRVNNLLNASGFTSLCKGNRVKPDFSGDKQLSVVSGVGGRFRDEIVDFIQARAYKNAMDAETEFVFGDAVQETINNVRLHAYPDIPDKDKKWWLLCEVIGQQLFLTIYDQGIGIPKTVTDREWFLQSYEQEYPQEYKEILDEVTLMGREQGILSSLKFYQVKKWSDPQLVYVSMLGDISGTKQRKHGSRK